MKALALLISVTAIACEVHASTGPTSTPTVDRFDERLSADCGDAAGSAQCEKFAAETARLAARCEKQQDEASRIAEMPDCSSVARQLARVRVRLATLHPPSESDALAQKGTAAEPGQHLPSNATDDSHSAQPTPEPDHGPCKAEKQIIVPERDDSGQPTGQLVAVFPGTRTWTRANGDRVTEGCMPGPAEIALLPTKDRKPLTQAAIKAQVAAAARRPKTEMQQEMEDDMAYRRAHGQAPGQTPIPAGHYEVTGAH